MIVSSGWRRVIAVLAIGILALAAAGLLFAWSGLYSVAASRGHWRITEWLLDFGMRQSVATHSLAIRLPPLDDGDRIRLGAAHFHGACAYCHGAPGVEKNPQVQGMLPPPPDLGLVSPRWRDRELFWIVKHGIKYTGMPAWPSLTRDDEVWAVTAFLRQLPSLDTAQYRELAIGDVVLPREDGRDIAMGRVADQAASACGRCHGYDTWGPPSKLVPVLHGQPAAFLLAAINHYAQGARESGFMQTIAADLAPDARRRVADYYSKLARPAQPKQDPVGNVENGRLIAEQGLAPAGIPPCLTCHGQQALATYPRLAGQQAAYMQMQLRLWRGGANARTPTGAIMAPIARLLSDSQIEDVSTYFAALDDAPTGGKRP